MRAHPYIQKVIVFVIIVLLLSYSFSAFIPHHHDCGCADCALCAMAETLQELLIALFLVLGAVPLLQSPTVLSGYTAGFSACDKTLVSLKVKLSD